jgi:hypothetical protein
LFVWGSGPVKGIVFNLLEEVVRTKCGDDAGDTLVDAARPHRHGDERCLLKIAFTPRAA